jgi:hypothetical protein
MGNKEYIQNVGGKMSWKLATQNTREEMRGWLQQMDLEKTGWDWRKSV